MVDEILLTVEPGSPLAAKVLAFVPTCLHGIGRLCTLNPGDFT